MFTVGMATYDDYDDVITEFKKHIDIKILNDTVKQITCS